VLRAVSGLLSPHMSGACWQPCAVVGGQAVLVEGRRFSCWPEGSGMATICSGVCRMFVR